jgi:uncharacterized membrane protein YfcA
MADLPGAPADWLPMVLALIATGAVGGVLAGLLGVGGGIVIVPALDYVLGVIGIDPAMRMHVAVATSLATIIPTALSSTRAHAQRGAVDNELARAWSIPIALGAAVGAVLAGHARSSVLTAVFGVVALLAALKMILPFDEWRLGSRVPRSWAAAPLPFGIGLVSTVMGIGGGTVSVPAMTLYGEPIHRAVGTAALFGLLISVPGTAAYLLASSEAHLPWGTVGLVSIPGVLVIAPMTMLTAPLGARLAHALSRRHLAAAFGLFLALVAARMLWRTFTTAGAS